jgi:hypothetical protein
MASKLYDLFGSNVAHYLLDVLSVLFYLWCTLWPAKTEPVNKLVLDKMFPMYVIGEDYVKPVPHSYVLHGNKSSTKLSLPPKIMTTRCSLLWPPQGRDSPIVKHYS